MKFPTSEVVAIFGQAIDFEPGAARSAFLDKVCAEDRQLRQELEELISSWEGAGAFLNQSAGAPILDAFALQGTLDGPGTIIGPYKLLKQIGDGGMGVVFMAEQQVPVRRRVALKIIKPGMDTRQVIARFDAERQALALMDHPNIARALDAGVTDSGRPYFVMELVRGIPITSYCDQNSLSIAERLELFVQVCHAVQHAHQNGIIHRDIKPSNVLVTMHDGRGVPKVIDFGVAKATNGQLTEKTLFTNFSQMIGTPSYMSPEQAEMSGLDVDTRSDIYSLGVLLYELLAGTTPFDKTRLHEATYDEMRRIIREEDPPAPSAFVKTLGQATNLLAAQRRIDSGRYSRLLRGDLDWIVMKALEKERGRRYPTANSLAEDIGRHLRHEPVEARPPSTVYSIARFARRNRAALVMVIVVSATLVAGTILSTWQAIRATRAERRVEAALLAESQQRVIAERERNESDRRRAQTEAKFRAARWAVDNYFSTISESKSLATPELRSLRKELLESAITFYRQMIDQSDDDPLLQAELADGYVRVGNLMADELGSREQAITALTKGAEVFERLVREHPNTTKYLSALALAKSDLGSVLQAVGRLAEAESSYRNSLVKYEELTAGLSSSADLRAAMAQTLVGLASAQTAAGKPAQAERSCRHAIELCEQLAREGPAGADFRRELVDANYQLGHAFRAMMLLPRAEAAYRKSIELYEELAGENRSDAQYWSGVAGAWYNLGHVQRVARHYDSARASYRRSLEVYDRLSAESPTVALYPAGAARSSFHLGLIESATGHQSLAQQSWTAAIGGLDTARELGYSITQSYIAKGEALAMLGRWQDAADSFSKAVAANEDDWKLRCQLAALEWAAGDEAGYKQTFAELMRGQTDAPDLHEAAALVAVCLLGPGLDGDASKGVVAMAEKVAASDPANIVERTLVAIAKYRTGETQASIAALEPLQPLYDAGQAPASITADRFHATQLLGATALMLAYRDLGDSAALDKQRASVIALIQRMESVPPEFGEGSDRWTLPLALHLARRELRNAKWRMDIEL